MSLDERKTESDLSQVELRLAALRPQACSIGRDELLFAAGRQAESIRTSRNCHLWRFATAIATATSATFAFLLIDARRELGELEVALQSRPGFVAMAATAPRESPTPRLQTANSQSDQPGAKTAHANFADLESGSFIEVPGATAMNYLGLRNRALRFGVDAVADATQKLTRHTSPGSGDVPATNGDLRQRYIGPAGQTMEFEPLPRG